MNKGIFANQGKPGYQAMVRRFARNEHIMSIDINQDFYAAQTMAIPQLLARFDAEDSDKLALIGYPEDIFTGTFSTIGRFHDLADRTFNSLIQPNLYLLGAVMHYGHPDVWDAAYVDAIAGVSR